MHVTEDQLETLQKRLERNRKPKKRNDKKSKKEERKKNEKPKRRHKYNAKTVIVDGIKFPSMAEAEFYKLLKQQMKRGDISHFHRQVIFDLNGVTAKVDFMVINPGGSIEYYDVKGVVTAAFKRNQKQIKEIYNYNVIPVFYRKGFFEYEF